MLNVCIYKKISYVIDHISNINFVESMLPS